MYSDSENEDEPRSSGQPIDMAQSKFNSIIKWDESEDWVYQYMDFMTTYKLWTTETFNGKTQSSKETFKHMIEIMRSPSYSNDPKRAQVYAYTLLCHAEDKRRKNLNRKKVWLTDDEQYKYKWFITLNLPPEKSMLDAKEVTDLFLSKASWATEAQYVVEYHTKMCHPHTHILIKTNNERMRCLSNVVSAIKDQKNNKYRSTFKFMDKYLGMGYVKICQYNSNQDKYVAGDKKEDKMENVQKDRAMREQFNLEDIYYYKK